ncbi:MAG: hypothetical protein GTN76_07790 [Candidatus Aenigmarchaeota archaeon]|nr:hypothetical protein [Candidatus Aenigmarchaeota archaeon]
MKIQERGKKKLFLFIVIVVVIISLARMYWEDYFTFYNPECAIEYGNGKCVDGYLMVPFYNPNQQDITSIKIVVPFGVKTNVSLPADYTVNEPLNSRKTGVLKLVPCESDVDIRSFSLEWCCSRECYNSKMNRISDKIEMNY